MKNHTSLRYYWKEGVHNIFLHGFTSLAAVVIIVACLVITGSAALISFNIDRNIEALQSESEIIIYLDESVPRGTARSLQGTLLALPNVASATFESREDALEKYKQQYGDAADMFDGFDSQNNPLRDGYHITMKDVTKRAETLKALQSVEGVAKIRVNEDTVSALVRVQHVFRVLSLVLLIALGCISIIIISNTVKLAMQARQQEIAIQKMVGATNWFIRWPFVIEGLLLGLTAGILSFFAQWGMYAPFAGYVGNVVPSFTIAPFSDILGLAAAVCLLAGVIVGVCGSVLTIRRFMDV